jgi:hypothetical protein
MGPISSLPGFPAWLDLAFAFVIGTGFGFALEQAGFSSCRKLTGMFYGYDTTVIKVFFTAAIVALVGSQFLAYFGLLDLSLVFVNEYYVNAALIGGVIMGAGFILGGYCPGTGLSTLHREDRCTVLCPVRLTGAFLFCRNLSRHCGIANGDHGDLSGSTRFWDFPRGIYLLLIGAAVCMFWIAEIAERKFARPENYP